jgi:hypothetical protein
MLHVWFGIIPGGVQHLTHAVRRRPKGTLLFAICRGKKSRREGGKQLREMVFLYNLRPVLLTLRDSVGLKQTVVDNLGCWERTLSLPHGTFRMQQTEFDPRPKLILTNVQYWRILRR